MKKIRTCERYEYLLSFSLLKRIDSDQAKLGIGINKRFDWLEEVFNSPLFQGMM